MRKLFDVLRIANEGRTLFYNLVPRRGIRYQENLNWVRPEKKPVYHRERTGDLVGYPVPKYDSVYGPFKDSKELQNADEKVKKVFSLGYQLPKTAAEAYENELVERVKSHAHDTSSDEVKIAKLTAKIRYFESMISVRPRKNGQLIERLKESVDARKKKLKLLRLKDYKRFEWLLDKLDLEFRPPVNVLENRLLRRNSLTLLARLKVEQAKEEKLGAYRKMLDEQKVPFLEKKITKLREIKEKEEKHKLPPTVTDEDIQKCIEKLERVKVEVAERAKKGYVRKIHPYSLEAYEEDVLWKKEKAAELIREKEASSSEKEQGETNISK